MIAIVREGLFVPFIGLQSPGGEGPHNHPFLSARSHALVALPYVPTNSGPNV